MISKIKQRIHRGLKLCDGFLPYLQLEKDRVFRRKALCTVKTRFRKTSPLYFRAESPDFPTMISCFLDGFHRPVKNLPEDPVIFDLGVNVGYTLVDFKHLFPNSKIVGVEMDKQNAELANKNISGLDGIEIHHAAIFHKDDVIYYDSDDEPDAFHAQSETSGKPSLVRVDAITLDTLMTKSNLTHIDYMKMDIEGAEQEIFSKGNLEWLERVDQISIEIHSGVDREMIETALKESGMNVENHPTHWSSIIGWRI